MPVDAHSRQGAPSLLATRYGGPITIRAKEGMPKANLKAKRTQRSPLDCSISVCLRLLTAGWYVVTNSKILSLAFFFCVKAAGLAAKLTPERDLSVTVLG